MEVLGPDSSEQLAFVNRQARTEGVFLRLCLTKGRAARRRFSRRRPSDGTPMSHPVEFRMTAPSNICWRVLRLIAIRACFGLTLISFAVGFVAFDACKVPSEAEIRQTSAGVVFSGAFERVDAGLNLLSAGYISRLYISGLNAGAGIVPRGFVDQFAPRNPNITDLKGLVACCVEWGENAQNTLENATETSCWMARQTLKGPLLLITSRLHMPRAAITLSRALPNQEIIPYPVDDDSSSRLYRTRTLEFLKYLATIAVIHVPRTDRFGRHSERSTTICLEVH
jgi:uncharacterized SAM-binding protein YcdF (DUF218 family)